MAQQTLDPAGNEPFMTFVGKLTAMFTELYNSFGGATNPSVSSLTVSGSATLGSATLDSGTKTATASSGAATLNKSAGVITSESLTTAAGSTYTLTLTNSKITANSIITANALLGTSTHGVPTIVGAPTPAAGSCTIAVKNTDSTNAFNGTIQINFAVLN